MNSKLSDLSTQRQRGGTAMGVIVGLLVGLGLALAVALYVTKVPVPFVNKVPQRTAEQDAAEIERNRNWDPNAKLGGAAATKPPAAVGGAPAPTDAAKTDAKTDAKAGTPPPYVPPVPPATTTPGAAPATAAKAPAAASAATAATPKPATPPAQDADKPAPVRAGADPYTYFVQAGAYTRQEDAEQQKGRLALLGRTMYRVRLGPFESKESATAVQGKLQQSGVDAALAAVEKSAR
jgi:cell division protein FtsN